MKDATGSEVRPGGLVGPALETEVRANDFISVVVGFGDVDPLSGERTVEVRQLWPIEELHTGGWFAHELKVLHPAEAIQKVATLAGATVRDIIARRNTVIAHAIEKKEPRGQSVHLLLRLDERKAHFRFRLFGGPDRDHLAMLGEITARPDEADALQMLFAHGPALPWVTTVSESRLGSIEEDEVAEIEESAAT